MSTNGKLTPKLRFPEFRAVNDWEEHTIGQLSSELLDGDWIESKDQSDSGFRLIQTGNVGVGVFLAKSGKARYISEETFARLRCTEVFPGDILVSRLPDPAGRSCLLPDIGERMITAVDCAIMRFDEQKIVPYLFVAHSQTDQYFREVAALSSGSTRQRISREHLSRVTILLSSLPEQQKIADCLLSLDDLIGAEGRKLESLRAYKKGLMQQLFPRDGEITPRLRFPEFRKTGDWAIRKLSDFIVERSEIAGADIPLFSLTIEDGVTAKTERYERSFLVNDEESAYKVVQPNDFAFNPMNLRFGAIARHSGEKAVALSKYYNIFYCDPSMDPRYCGFYFKTADMVSLYDRIATGSLIEKRRVHFDRFLKLDLPFPDLNEQRSIANCFLTLDERISAQSERLAALRTHKKGLMQQLFPSAAEGEA